jgi:5'-deoxynucleotidase YfbR-like HD superfamily hydrolase
MALVHDIGEAIIGDITPSDGISKGVYTFFSITCTLPIKITEPEYLEDKYRRESLAVEYLSCLVRESNTDFAAEIRALFEEFEACKTPEAQFVKQIDAFECLVQAEEYEERAHEDHRFRDFLHLEARVTSPALNSWTKILAQERDSISSKRSLDTVIIFVIGRFFLLRYFT